MYEYIFVYTYRLRCRDSSVGIATDWTAEGVEVRVKNFVFSALSRPALGAHPDSYQMGTGGPFSGGKAAGAWS
jgi:hypothetical protein